MFSTKILKIDKRLAYTEKMKKYNHPDANNTLATGVLREDQVLSVTFST